MLGSNGLCQKQRLAGRDDQMVSARQRSAAGASFWGTYWTRRIMYAFAQVSGLPTQLHAVEDVFEKLF